MKRVVYTNSNGFKQVRVVPDNVSESNYHKGVIAGPPDLSEVTLSKNDRRKLNNALVDRGFIKLEDTNLRRAELLKLIKETLNLDDQQAKPLRMKILGIYQRQLLATSPGVEITIV